VWDNGTYEPAASSAADLRAAFDKGRVSFTLYGKRLAGAWTIFRMHHRDRQWLLVKQRDEHAQPGDDLAQLESSSVVSNRTLGASTRGAARRSARPAARAGASRGAKKPNMKKGAAPAPRARPAQRVTSSTITAVSKQLEALRASGDDGTLTLGRGRPLEVSSPDKVYFPKSKITKGDLLEYYTRVSPALLPLIANRPLILKRFPEGISRPSFFQHDAPENTPTAVRVARVPAEGGFEPRLIGGDLATLLYQVQLGAIEVNPWLSRVGSFGFPDYCVLDLDPGDGVTFARLVQVARWVHDTLDELELKGVLKTSGKRGLHVYVPLPPRTSFQEAQRAGQRIAARVAGAHPAESTIERSMKKRPKGSVYVDYVQNDTGKSVAAAFSVRAKEGAPVSTPLAWDELTERLDPAAFTIETVLDDVAERAKLWAAGLRARNRLDALGA
jgi:bifunctional non-homologous end joining protein LigD